MSDGQEKLADNIAGAEPNVRDELADRSIDELIAMGVELRDQLTVERRKFQDFETFSKGMLLRIGMALKVQGDKLGVDSFKTKEGTAYRNVKESYRVGVWDEVIKFIIENQFWHMLEKRVAKLATKEIHKETGSVPPGVEYVVEEVFVIRRPNEKGNRDE